MKQKLRIGLLIDDYLMPAWAYEIIKDIIISDHSKIVLIVKNKSKKKEKRSILKRLWIGRKIIGFVLLQKIDRKLFKCKPDAFEIIDIRPSIQNCQVVEVSPKQTKFSDIIEENGLSKIRPYDIDVLIRLGFRILRGEILNIAKYGIWSYHHGDNSVNRGGPPGVWEVIQRWDETGVILQILTEDLDGGIKLGESFSATDNFSFNKNCNNLFWKASSMLPRKLQELHDLGEEKFFNRLDQSRIPQFYFNRLFRTPTNYSSLKAFLQIFAEKLYIKVLSFFFIEQWIILYKLEEQSKLSTSFFRFKKILPPKDRFWADPFVIERDNRYYIFIEEFIYRKGKGRISVIEMDAQGNYFYPQVVLERDYHLSYPFLFEENGTLYMIPETSQNRTIELYKCVSFPTKWEFCTNLMKDIVAVDSTIVRKDNKYWLFCNVVEKEGASHSEELFLYYSDSLLSKKWTPHVNNPIISDVKKSRPAGNIFEFENSLYRPSQDCAKRYGHGMKINEIIELNEKSYKEKPLQSIYPNWEKVLKATHTINNTGKLTVIDAIMRRRR